tara:strand:- start:483 stop:872 length:390 start_codon:yes stop_codon:yes gene_type:complete
MKEFNDIKGLFKKILGSEVNIKDNIQVTEKSVFCLFIKKLEESNKIENELIETGGIDCNKVTDPLWIVIENLLKFVYGEQAADTILWYIYDRFNPDGTVIPLEDEDGKQYIITTPDDLWSYIKYRYPTK